MTKSKGENTSSNYKHMLAGENSGGKEVSTNDPEKTGVARLIELQEEANKTLWSIWFAIICLMFVVVFS